MPITSLGFRYPTLSAAPNVPQDLGNLAADIDAALAGAWTSYTPVWSSTGTQPVRNNGTLTGAYKDVGRFVHVRIELVFGSLTTAGTGAYSFSLPFVPKANSLLPSMFVDQSAGPQLYVCVTRIVAASATGDNMRIAVGGSTNVVGATVPVTPAVSDVITISGMYEKS
jgi:hypothetical protein